MNRLINLDFGKVAWSWILVILLLSFGVACSAKMHARTFGVERQSPAGIALQEDGDWDSNETSAAGFEVESLAEKSGWQQIPPWLQIILTIGIALLIYYGILTLIQQKHKNKEEIVHYKDGTGDPENMYQDPRDVPQTGPAPRENRMPPQNRPDGQERPQIKKKNTTWPYFVIMIVIFNIISKCIGDN